MDRLVPPMPPRRAEALALPFPLRPAFLAQVVVPRDMTKDEARRLCAFIASLACVAVPAALHGVDDVESDREAP